MDAENAASIALHERLGFDRVARFHAATLEALSELGAAAGLDHPAEFQLEHFRRRVSTQEVRCFSALSARFTRWRAAGWDR